MPEEIKDRLPDDIDLFVLIERTILFFKKYKWIFLVAFLLGLATGIVSYKKLPNVYKSRLVLQSFTLSNPNFIQIIDNWNSLLKKGEHKSLAEAFNCSEKTLSEVKQIKASEVQKIFTQNNPNGIYIDVFIRDNALLPELQNGIIYGLENNEYVKQQLGVKRENLRQLIKQVSIEITKLDSTKNKVERIIGSRQGGSSSLMIDVSGLHGQLIGLNEKLLSLQQDLKFTSAVQVLQSFSKFSKPAGPNLIVTLGVSIIGFLALAYIVTLIRSINTRLKNRSIQAEKKTI
jgi:hypothetical protein